MPVTTLLNLHTKVINVLKAKTPSTNFIAPHNHQAKIPTLQPMFSDGDSAPGQSCAKGTFSWGHFFTEMHESFCILSMKGSVTRICKNILKKVSQKNRNFRLKIGFNSGCNIKYTWSLKVKYLLNGSTDLYEILNLSS